MQDMDDEKDVSYQTWTKMANSLYSEGFREGSSVGSDESFQKGFDAGYSEGFRIGHRLGLHGGILKYLSSEKSLLDSALKEKLSTVDQFEKPSRGFCILCSDEQEFDGTTNKVKSIEEIARLQNEKFIEEDKKLTTNQNYLNVIRHKKIENII